MYNIIYCNLELGYTIKVLDSHTGKHSDHGHSERFAKHQALESSIALTATAAAMESRAVILTMLQAYINICMLQMC